MMDNAQMMKQHMELDTWLAAFFRHVQGSTPSRSTIADLVLWTNDEELGYGREIIDAFTKKHPEKQIEKTSLIELMQWSYNRSRGAES